MTTYKLPAELKRHLSARLPGRPFVEVIPRDARWRKCAAYAADQYEVLVRYTTTDSSTLDALEEAVRAVPGVSATTQIRCVQLRPYPWNRLTNPDWPAALGTSRPDFHMMLPQVLALIPPRATGEPALP